MFKINIEDRTVNTLFDTGATRSVMSADTFKILKLKDKDLITKNIPQVVGANGTSLGAIGQITCEIKIGKKECKQTFLVCQNLKRNLILGVDSTQKHAAGVHWTKHNSFVLTIDGEKVAETNEKHQNASVSLKRKTKLPPRGCAVVDVDINTISKDKVQIIPDEYCLAKNPNMYMYTLYADLADRTQDCVTPFVIVNLSTDQHLEFPKDHIVAFTQKDESEGEIFQIEQVDTAPRHWVPQRPTKSVAEIAELNDGKGIHELLTTEQLVAGIANVEAETDLHKILTSSSNFIKSPAEVEAHRKVDLEDQVITRETKVQFDELCDQFKDIISQGSDNIGKTLLVEMDIDTGDSPPITSKPYTLALKHFDWVKKEITTLECARIITKSISP